MRHELVGGTLNVERDPKTGEAKGVVGRCTCGWSTGYRFSPALASCAFRDHQENPDAED